MVFPINCHVAAMNYQCGSDKLFSPPFLSLLLEKIQEIPFI
jgi:hypothetical protein